MYGLLHHNPCLYCADWFFCWDRPWIQHNIAHWTSGSHCCSPADKRRRNSQSLSRHPSVVSFYVVRDYKRKESEENMERRCKQNKTLKEKKLRIFMGDLTIMQIFSEFKAFNRMLRITQWLLLWQKNLMILGTGPKFLSVQMFRAFSNHKQNFYFPSVNFNLTR